MKKVYVFVITLLLCASMLLGSGCGAPKKAAEPTPAPAPDLASQNESAASASGQYDIAVTDESGNPVEGVALQICDESTCQVAKTDENGLLSLTMTPYPYEIHVLIAPEGFAKDTATYTLPEAGGSLVIQLKKQS